MRDAAIEATTRTPRFRRISMICPFGSLSEARRSGGFYQRLFRGSTSRSRASDLLVREDAELLDRRLGTYLEVLGLDPEALERDELGVAVGEQDVHADLMVRLVLVVVARDQLGPGIVELDRERLRVSTRVRDHRRIDRVELLDP